MTTHRRKSAHNKDWIVGEPAPADFLERLDVQPIIATLLHQRQVRDPQTLAEFFDATYPNGLHDPLLLKGMAEATDRIVAAIARGEPLAVYGDYDTDGVTAVALLMKALPAMGATIRPYIPNRVREGYGLNTTAIKELATEGVRLLITVDCGISNVEEVDLANDLGLDVIVTDHHHPPPTLPRALAVVNPKQPGCPYPYKQLVGVGIAFKLVRALIKRHNLRMNGGADDGSTTLRWRDLLDVVALGTVTDMAPLDGENRILVKAGLKAINLTERPGLRALIKAAGLTPGKVDATAIGFMLGPRINAAGRLDDAHRAYELLLTDDPETAEHLAQELNRVNRERQDLTRRIQAAAQQQAEETGKDQQRIVFLSGEGYPSGIVGLVAGKLVEQWGRPVVLIERGDETSTGSARSIRGFNIIETLGLCKDLLLRYGGHSMAAGFTLATERLPELDARLQSLAEEHLHDDTLIPRLDINADVAFDDLTWELFDELQRLEPFGQGNSEPVFMSRALEAVNIRRMGKQNQHLKFQLRHQGEHEHGGKTLDAVAFGLGNLEKPLYKHPWIDVAYTLDVHDWNGMQSLRLNVKDFRRA